MNGIATVDETVDKTVIHVVVNKNQVNVISGHM